MSAASEYAELLKLIEVSGPFLSLPVFREVFPQGLVKDAPDLTRELREIYAEWCAARALAPQSVSPVQREWVRAVFLTLLEWPAGRLAEDNAIPQNLSHVVAQHHETLRPDAALLEDGKPRLLISLLPPAQQPDRRPPNSTWNATCAARMAELLHATHVPLGLVTNGERFTLVYAEPGQPTGFADFHAELWFDERLTLRAFRDFLSAGALFNRPPEQTLDALYRRSLENQQEVSITLGRQVRRAVEMFVAALDRADRESGRALLVGLDGELIYEAALALMMRLVFLFFAEERDLLPITNPVYRENYAVSTLHDQLREDADRLGEEVLERRYDAFPRLLASFRAVHGGVTHDLVALPAYGGDLFDPDRFPFLEGRAPGSDWRTAPAQPCPIHNRTVLHLLGALQFLEMKVPGGGREKRRLSFRALDIEQIGHVYEGLLDHTARRAKEIVLGLDGKEEPDVALSELNHRRAQPDFVEWLADETGRSAKAIESALAQTTVDDLLRWAEWEQVAPFAGLVRRDDNGDPWVIPAGSIYVTAGTARRQTGTQYTPRSLTESVVEYALAPLVYAGPTEGQPPEAWRLQTAGRILDLKICDFACGSAAFLVAAARYLSARLAEAWDAAQREHGAGVQITPYGHPSSGLPEEELIPPNPDERGLYALRIVVERCLYGVDRNPLAVEMAKLSLWLLTLQRGKPFTFLDHAIRCGDSLLGVTLKQLETFSLSGEGNQHLLQFQDDLNFAADKRDGISKAQYHPNDQQRLLDAALAKTLRIRTAADLLIATAFENHAGLLAQQVAMGLEQQEAEARRLLVGQRPFHWPVEFPEVFVGNRPSGFDGIVGNPPFLGGLKLQTQFGARWRAHVVTFLANNVTGVRGTADLCSYFFLRAGQLLRTGGTLGLLGTNTVAQGDSREVGPEQLMQTGYSLYRALSSKTWPGAASLDVTTWWMRRGSWNGAYILDDREVSGITSLLTSSDTVTGVPRKLAQTSRKALQGSNVVGLGFLLSTDEAEDLLARDPRNGDVLFPYLNGEDLNTQPDQTPTRWVINFHDWPIEQAAQYAQCFERVRLRVKPERDAYLPTSGWNKALTERWWLHAAPRVELYRQLRTLPRVMVRSRIASMHAVAWVPSTWVYNEKTIVFLDCSFGLIQSSIHEAWARQFSSTLQKNMQYTPSNCFETFAFPSIPRSSANWLELESLGDSYHAERQAIMSARQEGLTSIYNRLHSPTETSRDITHLRELHVELDQLVARVYGWDNLDLCHRFHDTRRGVRYTISETARCEVLERLLALNHRRCAEEQASAQPAPKPKLRSREPEHPGLF
jgi:hypothetical protein